MTATAMVIGFLLLLAAAAASLAAGWRLGQQQGRAQAATSAAEHEAEAARWGTTQARLGGDIARLEGELSAETRTHAETRAERDRQREQNGKLEQTVEPLRGALAELQRAVGDAERARVRAQTELTDRVTTMSREFGEATADVRAEARRLSQVLSRNEKRGAWGEMQLRQLVESSGMLRHVHFVEQDHSVDDDKVLRPDMVVDLAGGRRAIVDSKVPLDAFLRLEAGTDQAEALIDHANGVAQHITKLSDKEYWKRYDTPEFVVMFLPSEALLSAALEARPELLQQALDKRVLLATPTTLMAILHAVSFSWRQAETADHARQIQHLGSELYDRIITMAKKFETLGLTINRTVKAYDETIATMESRVLPSARRMSELSIGSGTVPELTSTDKAARPINPAKWLLTAEPEPEIVDPQLDLGPEDGGQKLRSA